MRPTKVLITGANGQIGRVLTEALRKHHGDDNVLATDITEDGSHQGKRFEFLDILNEVRLKELIEDNEITRIYHLAAILSANGEYNPLKTWNVNLNGFLSLLECARELDVERIFFPSTIAVFGPTTPRIETPQDSPLLPGTVYGMSKVTGELFSNYYWKKYGIDTRSVRYPGIIGYQSLPMGGTTDYAVEIFHAAVQGKEYECFLSEDRALPMMYMPDAIRATIELMDAEVDSIQQRSSYNLSAMTFSPRQIEEEICKHLPDFKVRYKPDFRDEIAQSWSESIDDTEARKDWNWKHQFDLSKMVVDMLQQVSKIYK